VSVLTWVSVRAMIDVVVRRVSWQVGCLVGWMSSVLAFDLALSCVVVRPWTWVEVSAATWVVDRLPSTVVVRLPSCVEVSALACEIGRASWREGVSAAVGAGASWRTAGGVRGVSWVWLMAVV